MAAVFIIFFVGYFLMVCQCGLNISLISLISVSLYLLYSVFSFEYISWFHGIPCTTFTLQLPDVFTSVFVVVVVLMRL